MTDIGRTFETEKGYRIARRSVRREEKLRQAANDESSLDALEAGLPLLRFSLFPPRALTPNTFFPFSRTIPAHVRQRTTLLLLLIPRQSFGPPRMKDFVRGSSGSIEWLVPRQKESPSIFHARNLPPISFLYLFSSSAISNFHDRASRRTCYSLNPVHGPLEI